MYVSMEESRQPENEQMPSLQHNTIDNVLLYLTYLLSGHLLSLKQSLAIWPKTSFASVADGILSKLYQTDVTESDCQTLPRQGWTVFNNSLLFKNVCQIYQAFRPKLNAPTSIRT